ncbi:pisatin demethylase [Aspergillus venezuelensis]
MFWISLAPVVVALLYGVYQLFLHPLARVPGPWLARWTRFWEWSHLRNGKLEYDTIRLHQRYGSVVRIAPNRYSISSPDAVQHIYGHTSRFTKDRFYRAFGHPDESKFDLFSMVNVQTHASRRRKVASLYSMSSLVSYEPAVDKCISLLVDRFGEVSAQGKSASIPHWMEYFAFDVVGSISGGEMFGMMREGDDSDGILDIIHRYLAYTSKVGLFCEWYSWIGGLNHLLGRGIAINKINAFTLRCLASHRDNPASSRSGNDFIDQMFKMQKEGKVDDEDIFSTINGNIVAGADSSAITLSAAIYYLAHNSRVRQKLRDEIDAQPEGPISFSNCQAMPYLQAVIKETLRLHPATGMILPRVSPPEGAMVAGHFFPAKTVVGVNAWALHRNPQIYGADVDKFRPERWIGSKAEIAPLERNLFTFGAGSRTCLGKNISMLEITKVIPMLFRYFDFEVEAPWKTTNVFLVLQEYTCKVVPRRG